MNVPGPQVAREEILDVVGVSGPDPGEAAVGELGAVGLRVVVLGRHAVLGVGHVVRELFNVYLVDGCELDEGIQQKGSGGQDIPKIL